MPVRVGPASLAVRKRWRHRKAVLTATPQRSAEATTVSPSLSDRPNSSQRSFFRNPASGVPVSALKLLPHFLQRNRRTPFAAPQPTDAPSPQCGHRRSSPRLPSIAAVTAARGVRPPAPPQAQGADQPSGRQPPQATPERPRAPSKNSIRTRPILTDLPIPSYR